MKLMFIIYLVVSSHTYALDYDPQFHTKHRYNRHTEAQAAMEQKQRPPQKMESPKLYPPAPRKVK